MAAQRLDPWEKAFWDLLLKSFTYVIYYGKDLDIGKKSYHVSFGIPDYILTQIKRPTATNERYLEEAIASVLAEFNRTQQVKAKFINVLIAKSEESEYVEYIVTISIQHDMTRSWLTGWQSVNPA